MNAGELLFRLPSDPDKEEAVNVSWVTVPTLLPTAKFWDGLLPKVNLIMCWLKFLSMTVERRFSFEELSSQTQLSFQMDEQSPATNHKTSPRS